MAKVRLSEKQKEKLKNSDFCRSNSSDLTVNPNSQDDLEYDEDDGTITFDKRTTEGKEIERILKSRNRSKKQEESDDDEDYPEETEYNDCDENEDIYEENEDEDSEDSDEEDDDNELYNKWQKDPDSYDTRAAAKEELQYYVKQKAGYDWDPEVEENPAIVFIREMSELDSDFGDFIQDCYDEICDDQEAFSNFKKDFWNGYYK